MFVTTVIYILIFILSGPNKYITLKIIYSLFLALYWLFAIIYISWFLFNRFKAHSRLRTIFQEAVNLENRQYLIFNDQGITLINEDSTLELHWNYFSTYMEDDTTIYILTSGDSSLLFSYTEAEIGRDNLKALKNIVKQKLTPHNIPLKLK